MHNERAYLRKRIAEHDFEMVDPARRNLAFGLGATRGLSDAGGIRHMKKGHKHPAMLYATRLELDASRAIAVWGLAAILFCVMISLLDHFAL